MPGAQAILEKAQKEHPYDENIFISAFRIPYENGEFEEAELMFENVRSKATARVSTL